MPTTRPPFPVVNLASAWLAGPWTLRSLLERGQRAWPSTVPWMRPLVRRLVDAHATAPPLDALIAWLGHLDWQRVYRGAGRCYFVEAELAPRGPAAATWRVPPLVTAGQLAAWLDITPGKLDWLADPRGWTAKLATPKLRHYVCRWQPRRRGRFRLIESPKATLKKIQRRILAEILDRIPPHPAAHGFRAGRSIRSYAAAHVGQAIVLRFDLRDFFPSIPAARVQALFRTAGYPADAARLLTGLCTARVPLDVWEQRPEPQPADEALGARLRVPHLPQGAPTSPALANLCARKLDARLTGLARASGAVYTRYADDLAFSGGAALARSARRFQVAVAVIAAEEGFTLHFQKSRFMRRGVRQQLAGVVVNEHPNLRRDQYDVLKAILTNCVRQGPATQNRAGHADFRGHLLGRLAFAAMLNSQRGAKLRAIFERIVWPAERSEPAPSAGRLPPAEPS